MTIVSLFRFVSVLVCLATFQSATAATRNVPTRAVPEDRLLQNLKSDQFDVVDQQLQTLQQAYIKDRKTENDIHKAVYEFYRADAALASHLDKWVARRPNDSFAYLARGIFRTKMGWASRGSKWASETSSSQFSSMEGWFNAAKEDLTQAIELSPSLVEAYCYLIEIDMNEGAKNTETLFNRALTINPASFIAREFYLHSLLPRWGGSYDEMEKVVVASKPFYKEMPQLVVLEGRIPEDLGELATNNKNYALARQYFVDALAKGDFWVTNENFGEMLWAVDDYQGAIAQFNKVITYKPGYKRAYWMRAQAYKMLSRCSEALADITYTISIEPADDLAIASRGYIYQKCGDIDSALEDFNAAAKINPSLASHQQAILTSTRLLSRK